MSWALLYWFVFFRGTAKEHSIRAILLFSWLYLPIIAIINH